MRKLRYKLKIRRKIYNPMLKDACIIFCLLVATTQKGEMQKNLFRLQTSVVEERATPNSLHYTLDICAKVKNCPFLDACNY